MFAYVILKDMFSFSVCVCDHGGENRMSDFLELYMIVSHQVWVLGSELRASARVASALNC